MLRITENTENGKTVRLRLDGTVNAVSYLNWKQPVPPSESPGKSHLGGHGRGRVHEQRSGKQACRTPQRAAENHKLLAVHRNALKHTRPFEIT